jgi:hypothetical protein
LSISWNGITDINFDFLNILYLSGSSYQLIYSGSNTSPYNWNISSLTNGNYSIKISAFDKSGNTRDITSQTFDIDKSLPIIQSGAILLPTT